MSAAPQRGRRRAETTSRRSIFTLASARSGTHAAAPSAVTKTAKCMAAVAVVGALVTAGSIAQNVGGSSDHIAASLISALDTPTGPAPAAISAPTDAPISFADLSVTSTAKASAKAAPLKAESEAVKSLSTDEATKAPTKAAAKPAVLVDDPAAAQAYASGQLGSFGWGADQMNCLTLLWERESSWLTSAENPSSGAYGIAQSLPAEKMASTGGDWATNYKTQITWGLSYIQGRYGSPCGAWGHSEAVGWY